MLSRRKAPQGVQAGQAAHAGAGAPARRGPLGRGSLVAVHTGSPAALVLAAALMVPSSAFAATTTGYNQTPPPPKTTTGYKQTPPAPKKEAPKHEVGPKQEETTTKTTAAPTTTPAPAHEAAPTHEAAPSTEQRPRATTLPFTGLDLRWVVLGGALLLGSGLSLMVAQRKHGGARR